MFAYNQHTGTDNHGCKRRNRDNSCSISRIFRYRCIFQRDNLEKVGFKSPFIRLQVTNFLSILKSSRNSKN